MKPARKHVPFSRHSILPYVVTLLLLLQGLCPGATLTELRDVYETHLLKIRDECAVKTKEWSATYAKALQAYRETAQRAGDLDGLTSANGEMKRFKSSGTLAKQHLVTQPAGLRALQQKAVKDLAAYPLERDRAIVSLVERYVTRLESEKKRLTKAGKVSEALDMNAEIKRVEASPAVADARFNLALQPSSEPTKPVRPPSTVPKRPEPKPAKPVKPVKARNGMVYPNGLRPDSIKGVTVRRQSLSATANNPLARSVSVSLSSGNTKGSSSYRAGGRPYYHTIEVRTAKSDDELKSLKVYIDYFSKKQKSYYSSGGKLTPNREETHSFKLDRVTGETTTIVPNSIPSRSSSSYSSSSSSSYYYSTWYYRDYYGVIVTVFSGDNVLLYQGATAASLRNLGRTAP